MDASQRIYYKNVTSFDLNILKQHTKKDADCKDVTIRHIEDHTQDDGFLRVSTRGSIEIEKGCTTLYVKGVTGVN